MLKKNFSCDTIFFDFTCQSSTTIVVSGKQCIHIIFVRKVKIKKKKLKQMEIEKGKI